MGEPWVPYGALWGSHDRCRPSWGSYNNQLSIGRQHGASPHVQKILNEGTAYLERSKGMAAKNNPTHRQHLREATKKASNALKRAKATKRRHGAKATKRRHVEGQRQHTQQVAAKQVHCVVLVEGWSMYPNKLTKSYDEWRIHFRCVVFSYSYSFSCSLHEKAHHHQVLHGQFREARKAKEAALALRHTPLRFGTRSVENQHLR